MVKESTGHAIHRSVTLADLWDVPEPFEYIHVENDDGSVHLSKRRCDDGRVVDFLENGDKIVTFPNGMKKFIHHFEL